MNVTIDKEFVDCIDEKGNFKMPITYEQRMEHLKENIKDISNRIVYLNFKNNLSNSDKEKLKQRINYNI